jgi:C4-dicarboxylate-specific signal transduction histidine kinase
VVVDIRDSGCGMTADVLERAHDPFFSHRQAGRGRGLGLSRATRWLEINDAQLRLESEPDKGTTARVLLPTAQND